ncbi:MAG: hypothetical protein Q8R28_02345 [Dehalococcoidia bacterium]|nr:hypothetical protein [Dehalococcoidia bacterium]
MKTGYKVGDRVRPGPALATELARERRWPAGGGVVDEVTVIRPDHMAPYQRIKVVYPNGSWTEGPARVYEKEEDI